MQISSFSLTQTNLVRKMLFLILFASSSIASAYTQSGTEITNNISSVIRQSSQFGMVPTSSEIRVKNELLQMKKSNPLEFHQKLTDSFMNTAELQGWLFEVQDGMDQVAKAKSIAKWSLYQALQKNWSQIRTISINSNASQTWSEFSPYLVDRLNTIHYQSKDRENNFVFAVEDWGRVIVSPNFRSARWILNADARYDGNQLERGLGNIRIPRKSAPPPNF